MMKMMRLRIFSIKDASRILFARRTFPFRTRCFTTKHEDAVREDKLDFITASKILFSTPSKPRKFGIDFHLVQFFFACLPPLAVYLVAQYARYDMRKMEAELELKKKQSEEEEKSSESSSKLDSTLSSKEGELNEKLSGPSEISSKMKKRALETNGKPAPADKELQEMKSRLDAIEQVIKEITEAKKSYGGAREETQVKEGKEAVTTKGKGNANQNSISKVKDGSENKEVSPSDSIDVKNAAIVPKQKSTGEVDSPRSNMTTNLGSKNKGAISEGKR